MDVRFPSCIYNLSHYLQSLLGNGSLGFDICIYHLTKEFWILFGYIFFQISPPRVSYLAENVSKNRPIPFFVSIWTNFDPDCFIFQAKYDQKLSKLQGSPDNHTKLNHTTPLLTPKLPGTAWIVTNLL